MCSLGVLCCMCGVLGHLAPVHRCPRSACCVSCAASPATWLLFTGVPDRCVVLRLRCPGPLGSCSPVCSLGALCCLCGVLGHMAHVHRCARSLRCVLCAVSGATWLLFFGVLTWRGVLRTQCARPLGSCSPVCSIGALCCACSVLGHLAPVHRCARLAWCVACAASSATRLLFIGVLTPCVVLRVRCPGPLGCRSPVCSLVVLCCVCAVLGHMAPVHRRARSACCVACALSWATWLLFTGVLAPPGVLHVRRSGPLGSCSTACTVAALCCVCSFRGQLDPVHRCARSAWCVVCAVSWATWLLFTAVLVLRVVLCVRCPWPLGSCSPVCTLVVLRCMCGVLSCLAPVHRCARSACCAACAVSWAT